MVTRNRWENFKAWAVSHSLHHPDTKLPYKLSVEVHEKIVNFVHGGLFGLILGLILALYLSRGLGLL